MVVAQALILALALALAFGAVVAAALVDGHQSPLPRARTVRGSLWHPQCCIVVEDNTAIKGAPRPLSRIARVKMAVIKFCPECNNMLYPKEDRANRVLLFACRNCDHQEEAVDQCVYRNNVLPQAIETIQNVVGLASDPTFPRTNKRTCPKCGFGEAIYFQSHDRRRDTPMTLYFVCGNLSCNNLWSDNK